MGPTGNFAISGRPWIAAAALIFLIGTACTDQPDASEQGETPSLATDPGANANSPPEQEQSGISLQSPEERAELRKSSPFTLQGRPPRRRIPPAEVADAAEAAPDPS